MEAALKYIAETYGDEILRDGQKLTEHFANTAPNLSREQKLLSYFVQCNGNSRLIKVLPLSDAKRRQEWIRLTQYMETEMRINSDGVSLVCESFWNAASGGKIPVPVIAQTSLQEVGTIEIKGRTIQTDVTELKLFGPVSLTDLSLLSSLSNLTKLWLDECYSITDLSPLSSLSQLTSLDLVKCKSLTDLSPLLSLSQLKMLDLSWCEKFTDSEVVQLRKALPKCKIGKWDEEWERQRKREEEQQAWEETRSFYAEIAELTGQPWGEF